jgi:hypothetical protein
MLLKAAKVVELRRQAYGEAVPLMTTLAQRWSITLGRPVTPAQVVLCLIDLKLARLGHDPAHADSILDVAAMPPCCRRSPDEVAPAWLRRRAAQP